MLPGRSVSCYSVKYLKISKDPLLPTQTSWSQFGKPHPQGGKEIQGSQLAEVGAIYTSSSAESCLQLLAVIKSCAALSHLVSPGTPQTVRPQKLPAEMYT